MYDSLFYSIRIFLLIDGIGENCWNLNKSVHQRHSIIITDKHASTQHKRMGSVNSRSRKLSVQMMRDTQRDSADNEQNE